MVNTSKFCSNDIISSIQFVDSVYSVFFERCTKNNDTEVLKKEGAMWILHIASKNYK